LLGSSTLGARHVEEGPDDGPPAPAHAGETGGAGAAEQLHQHGLRLVVAVVRDGHGRAEPFEHAVTLGAAAVLVRGRAEAEGEPVEGTVPGELLHEVRVGGAAVSRAVVHGRDLEAPAVPALRRDEQIEEHHGVEPAAHRDDDAVSGVPQPVRRDVRAHVVAQAPGVQGHGSSPRDRRRNASGSSSSAARFGRSPPQVRQR
jgi:hypothetical protein